MFPDNPKNKIIGDTVHKMQYNEKMQKEND